jgi:hypothetical protein
MAFSAVISSARTNTTEEMIRKVFEGLDLGVERVDIVKATSRGIDCLKVFIHFFENNNPNAVRFRARLDDNDIRQKEGEIVPPIRVIYGRSRDGRDQYWQVYKTKTPAERQAEQAARLAEETAKAAEFRPRIEM